jgi:hypothetical protein
MASVKLFLESKSVFNYIHYPLANPILSLLASASAKILFNA